MKFIIIGFLLWFTLTLPSSARAGGNEYPIVTLGDTKATAKKEWRVCGSYFAAGESTVGKMVYFAFERKSPGAPARKVFMFVFGDRVAVSLEKQVTTPRVLMLQEGRDMYYVIRMNPKDYMAGLPCISTQRSTRV